MERLEATIITAFKRGDHEAFDRVYSHYRSLLYVIILGIVRHQATAEDVLQETFLTMYQKAASLKHADRFQSWAMRIAKHHAINAWKQMHHEAWDDLEDHPRAAPEERSLFQTWHHHLTDQENLIVAYKLVYDLSYDDIHWLMNLSIARIQQIYQQALVKLKGMYLKP
jgi:RNA polymerase sigma factor (sigma-70 family)